MSEQIRTDQLLPPQAASSQTEGVALEKGTNQAVEFIARPYVPTEAVYDGIDQNINPVIAEIDAGDNRFVIFGERGSGTEGEEQGYFIAPTVNKGYRKEDGAHHFSPTQGLSIAPGESFDLGRTKLDELNASLHTNNTLSRSHVRIDLSDSGDIRITQESKTNGTRVRFAEQEVAPEDDETVPREQVRRHIGSIGVEAANESSPKQETLQDKEKAINEQMSKLLEPFDLEVKRNVWRYAAEKINKTEAQQEGDGQGSIAAEQAAGQAYIQLPAEAQSVASQYLRLMRQHESILRRLG